MIIRDVPGDDFVAWGVHLARSPSAQTAQALPAPTPALRPAAWPTSLTFLLSVARIFPRREISFFSDFRRLELSGKSQRAVRALNSESGAGTEQDLAEAAAPGHSMSKFILNTIVNVYNI